MLDKFSARQRITGGTKENPFGKIDIRSLVNMAMAADVVKMDAVFKQTEHMLEDFFESKKNYYKNLKKEPYYRTEAVAQAEKMRDQMGDLAVKAKQIEPKVFEKKLDDDDKKIDILNKLTQASSRIIPSFKDRAEVNKRREINTAEERKKQEE